MALSRSFASRVLKSVLVMLAAKAATAGPLDPPAGPIAPTPGPEPRIAINAINTPGDNDVTPSKYRISTPGSYYLTQNLIGESGKAGLEIVADGVTVDLNGFSIIGGAGGTIGIRSGAAANVVIRNGIISGWAGNGLTLGGTRAIRIEKLVVSNCFLGIVLGESGVIQDSTFSNCSSHGINVAGGQLINVQSFSNGGCGFVIQGATTLTNCRASQNLSHGFLALGNTQLVNCQATENTGAGFQLAAVYSARDCLAESNGASGFDGEPSLGDGLLSECIARENGAHGFVVTSGVTLTQCVARTNGKTGTGAGILALGSDNRIEANNCTGADFGVKVDGPGNYIVRNTCSGNTTDWVFVANNLYGPIRDRRSSGGAAVNGFDAAGSLSNTEPNTNFSY